MVKQPQLLNFEVKHLEGGRPNSITTHLEGRANSINTRCQMLMKAAKRVPTLDCKQRLKHAAAAAAAERSAHRVQRTSTALPNGGLAAASLAANLAMPDASTANTFAAPACAANSDRIPEPAPTSMTTLPSKSGRLPRMAEW